MAGVKAEDVDLVVLCTSTPDDLFGGAAQWGAQKLLDLILQLLVVGF